MEAMCKLFEEEDRLAKEYLEEQEKETLDPKPVTFEDVYDSNDSNDDECHQCGALKPRYDKICLEYAGNYECPLCESRNENHKCPGCQRSLYCNSIDTPHICNIKARGKNVYECEICELTDLDYDCEGCRICGSYDLKYNCMYVLGEQAEE